MSKETNSGGPTTSLPSTSEPVAIEKLLKRLDYIPEFFRGDTRMVLIYNELLNDVRQLTGIDQRLKLKESDVWKNWKKKETGSGSLFIDANQDFNANRAETAQRSLSFVSAEAGHLMTSIKEAKVGDDYMLGYFCGLHRYDDDKEEWVPDMVKSLIGQLLTQYKEKATPLNLNHFSEEVMEDLEEGDYSALIQAFKVLMQQLPQGATVYCILDHVSLYENNDDGNDEDIEKMLRGLVAWSRAKRGKGLIVKLLFTSPGGACNIGDKDAGKLVTVDQVLTIPKD